MKNDKLIPGVILVMIGAIFLLHNFHVIHFYWGNLWHLWPIIIVIAGVNLVFAHNRSPWATILKISVVIAGFALLVFGNFGNRYGWWWPHHTYHYNSHDNDDSDDNDDNNMDDSDDNGGSKGGMVKVSGSSQFKEPYNSAIKVARLNISGGATTYRLTDTTNELFKANTKEHFGNYELKTHTEDSVHVMDFDMKGHKDNWNWNDNGNDNDSNIVNMMLNPNPEWIIDVSAGATELNFDLSKFKVRSLKLSGGAGSFTMKVGQPRATTNVNVSSGAADVTIEIPQNAACQIESSTGLSSNTYDGFNKKDDDHYETTGFDAAKNKIFIHISGFAGDFKVHKY